MLEYSAPKYEMLTYQVRKKSPDHKSGELIKSILVIFIKIPAHLRRDISTIQHVTHALNPLPISRG